MQLSSAVKPILMELSFYSLLKLLSFVIWSYSYIVVRYMYPEKSPEWASRVVTLVHGTVASCCGLKLCLWPKSIDCFLSRIGTCHYAMMLWSWGYFAFDLLWCLLYWTTHFSMLAHHAATLLAIEIYMNKPNSGCTYPCTIALMEVTNPLLQTRWFLREEGYERTKVFLVVELAYLSLFIILRGVLGTFLLFEVLLSPYFTADEKLLTLGFYGISLIFLHEIIGYIWHKYKPKIVSGFINMLDRMSTITF